jgi:hypothetical protein
MLDEVRLSYLRHQERGSAQRGGGNVYIRHVLTHAEYDEGKWKDE